MQSRIPVLLALTIVTLAPPSQAQKHARQKFNDAIKRSESGAEVISKLAQLSQNGIPKELIDKAEAIGVFPCQKTDLLFEHAVLCPGVISRHLQSGWSLPAFYRFGGGGFGRPDPALSHSAVMILLFLDKESVEWLGEAISLNAQKQAQAGPVGSIITAQREGLAHAHIIAYADRKDGLKGVSVKDLFWKKTGLAQDNHINEGLYSLKGHEILSGKTISAAPIPTEISAFQQALEKYYKR
jgi:lipid-binding SYLF domain-containing protein